MNESKISVRYAKALFQLALEKNQLEAIYNDMMLIVQVSKDVDQFNLYLKSPVVRPSHKINFVNTVFKAAVSETVLNFFRVLIENKRESDLDSIIRWFVHLYREYKGIKSATITTAGKLTDATKQNLLKLLSDVYKTGIELEINEDATLIGGFVLQIEDQQFDASVLSGIKRMKTALQAEINK